MDVRCTRCATEYEFDDAKVGATGVTVKCSSCGHVFKVSQSGATTTGSVKIDGAARKRVITGANSTEWLVRKADGTTSRLKELTTLQKWIVEQKVSRNDEISRTGKSWKRLGEIQELASFFQVVDAANIAASQPTMQNVAAPDVVAQMQAAERQLPTPSAPQAPDPAPPTGDVSQGFETSATLADLEDDDPVLAWKRRNRARNAAVLVLLLVVIGAAVAFLKFPAQTRAFVEPLLVKVGLEWPKSDIEKTKDKLVSSARQTRLADDDAAIETLKNAFEAVAPSLQEDGEFLAQTALVQVALATHAEERARLIAVLGQTTRDAQTANDERQSRLKSADAAASRARRVAPGLGLAFVANAWVRALKGERSEMAADLDVATNVGGENPEVVSEARALTAIEQATAALQSTDKDRLTTARKTMTEAMKANAADKRLAYYAAALDVELLAAQGLQAAASSPKIDQEALVVAVTALGAGANDERAALLMRRLNGVRAKEGAKEPAGEPAEAGTAKPTESYATLMKRANRARVGDKTRAALGLYKQALALRPSSPKALVGIGWSHLDLGSPKRAVSAFRDATKIAPDLPVAHFGLAEALLQAGKKTAAAAAYDVVLRLDPVGPDSAHARSALKRLTAETAAAP